MLGASFSSTNFPNLFRLLAFTGLADCYLAMIGPMYLFRSLHHLLSILPRREHDGLRLIVQRVRSPGRNKEVEVKDVRSTNGTFRDGLVLGWLHGAHSDETSLCMQRDPTFRVWMLTRRFQKGGNNRARGNMLGRSSKRDLVPTEAVTMF
ncbi:uncharacterized protein IWZ02DRAFT_274697 [Phyllosticta citriasiana]|uniref:uncharacterized protein n=1 Tax=Phyllosticta citriasiana TaxID=595635 RepID=UPI0030FD9573